MTKSITTQGVYNLNIYRNSDIYTKEIETLEQAKIDFQGYANEMLKEANLELHEIGTYYEVAIFNHIEGDQVIIELSYLTDIEYELLEESTGKTFKGLSEMDSYLICHFGSYFAL